MGITEYIKSKKEFDLMPFMTVYLTIIQLVKDGYIPENSFKTAVNKNV